MKKMILAVVFLLTSTQAHALSIDWTGTYRFEYQEVDKTSLDDPGLRKSYILNHLSLSPKIIAADGVNIVGKLEILPNDEYPDSQAGQRFGKGPKKATGTSSTKDDSAVAGQRQGGSTINVSQLYMNLNQEYGALLVGRAPIEFGLGMTYSAGNGAFDHWADTHDVIGYKVLIGNLSIMPMVAKVYDYSIAQGREVQDIIWDVAYNNPETESAIGIFHKSRSSSLESNDAPDTALGGSGIVGSWKTQHVNLYFSRGFEPVKIKLEAGFESGTTGISKTAGSSDEVSLGGYGIALELDFASESKWHWSMKAGMASGDNPTTNNYEGFHFDRNYNLGMLMFNHPLGKYDLLNTAAQRTPNHRDGLGTPYSTEEALDDDTISNAVFVAPRLVYNINEKWDWTNTLVWAQLQTNPLAHVNVDVSKDLGFEWDTGLVYKPMEKFMWINEVGFLFPGSAWQGGSNNYGKGFTYGFSSKAAISF